jgi:hypothetical protein
MYAKKPKATPLFLAAVDEIKNAGIELAPDEIVWLYQVAEEAIHGHDCGVPAYLQMPVQVGNCTLYPKTIGAGIWYEHFARSWFNSEPESELLCIAFMLAHSNDAETFKGLTSKAAASAAMLAWQIGLSTSCTLEQLAWGVNRVLGQHDYVEINTPNERAEKFPIVTDWGDIIARLSATYHQPPEYFVWQASEAMALDMLAKIPKHLGGPDEDPVKKRNLATFFEVKNYLKRRRDGNAD